MNSKKLSYFNDRKDRDNFTTLLINDIRLQLADVINRQLRNYNERFRIVDYQTLRVYWYKMFTNAPKMRKDISKRKDRHLSKCGWGPEFRFLDLCARLNIDEAASYDSMRFLLNPFVEKNGSGVFINTSIIDQINNLVDEDTLKNFELANTAYVCINNNVRNRFMVLKIDFKITNQNYHTILSTSMNQSDNDFDPIFSDKQLPYQNNGNIRYADSFMTSLKRADGFPTIFINLQHNFAKSHQEKIILRSLKLRNGKPLAAQFNKYQPALQKEFMTFMPRSEAISFNRGDMILKTFINIPQNINTKLNQIAINLISTTIAPAMFSASSFFMIDTIDVDSTLDYADDSDFNTEVTFSLKITTDKINHPKQYDCRTHLHLTLNNNGIIECSLDKDLVITNTNNRDDVLRNRVIHIFYSHGTTRSINIKSNQIFMFIKSAASSIADPLRLINHQPTYNSYPKKSLSDPDFRALLKENYCPTYRFVTRHSRVDQTQVIKNLLQTAIAHQLRNQHLDFKISSYKDLENCIHQYNPAALSTKFIEFNADWQKEFNINSSTVPVLDDYYLNFRPAYGKTKATPALILMQPTTFVNERANTISGICRVMFTDRSSNDFAVVTYMYMVRISDDEKGHEVLQIELKANPFKNYSHDYDKLVNEFGITCKSFDDSASELNQQLTQLMTINYQNQTDKQYIEQVKKLIHDYQG